jgi:glycosyltransferase involved in cell wall biosynthesis
VLNKLYTGYPGWKVDHIPREKVVTYPWLMTPYMVSSRLGWQRVRKRLEKGMVLSFDRWVKNNIDITSIFHCLSGFGLITHQYIRNNFKSITLCDRGSCHILFQQKILTEEYAKFQQKFDIDPWAVQRELDEYEICDYIILPSSFAARTFIDHGIPEDKIIKVPYGVDLSLFSPGHKIDQVFRVIYVGSLSIEKGIPYLLEAVHKLRLPNFEVYLIGGITPEIRPVLDKYAHDFKYLGFIPRHKLSEYYSQGSLLVMPSLQEGLSLVQAQAMACRIPVIATENSGADDLFTDGVEGFVIKAGDARAIYDSILKLYDQPTLRVEMGNAALQRVKEIGGWKAYGETMYNEYQTIIGHHAN